MFNYIRPILLVIISNVFYHICAKELSPDMNPLASLTVTYAVGAAASFILYIITNKGCSLITEMSHLNWAPLVLGLVIVGLEAGYIYAYKAGWQVSVAATVQSCVLAIILLAVGALFYKEKLTWNKAVGTAVCMIGLGIINLK